jgi:hypothetical protein
VPGTFSKTARPALPGAYTNYEVVGQTPIQPGICGIVAIPLVHNWGPVDEPRLVGSIGEF